MRIGSWTVCECPCGDLHPVYFDGYVGIDGDEVFDCPVNGKVELSDMPIVVLRELVSVEREEV